MSVAPFVMNFFGIWAILRVHEYVTFSSNPTLALIGPSGKQAIKGNVGPIDKSSLQL